MGTTSIENIPLDLVERIEVVKGPLSSLYGPDAIGGVVQIFTRASAKPRFFAAASHGSASETNTAAGFTTVEGDTTLSISAGARKVDAASATNDRAFCHDPDRDRYENAFAGAQLVTRPWYGETISLSGFVSRGTARFDGCPDAAGRFADDRNRQTLSGARLSSFMFLAPWWSSRFTLGEGRDELAIEGGTPARFETRQQQGSWVNEFGTTLGTFMAGLETLRQEVLSDTSFARTRRDTNSGFVAFNETWRGQRLEASWRRDEDDQFGGEKQRQRELRHALAGPGFRERHGGQGLPGADLLRPLRPGLGLLRAQPRPAPGAKPQPRTFLAGRARGGMARPPHRVRPSHRGPHHLRLPDDAERAPRAHPRDRGLGGGTGLGHPPEGLFRDAAPARRGHGISPAVSLAALRPPGSHRAVSAHGLSREESPASGPRFDSADESPASRLPGYAIADATVRYAASKRWSVELVATNLFDKRYEHALGYDAPRRSILLNLRFNAS